MKLGKTWRQKRKGLSLKSTAFSGWRTFSQERKACMRRGEEKVKKSKWK
jgi:hypothetical protein